MNIFGLKTFQKVYVENSKDIYSDRRVKLSNALILRALSNFIKIFKKKSDRLNLPCTECVRANKQLFFFFGLRDRLQLLIQRAAAATYL